MAQNHSENVKLAHFNMFLAPPAGLAARAPWLSHLPIPRFGLSARLVDTGNSEAERRGLRRSELFATDGRGYFALQSTRVRDTECGMIRIYTADAPIPHLSRPRLDMRFHPPH
jgi:hypothetical protein